MLDICSSHRSGALQDAPISEHMDFFDLAPVSLWLEDYSGIKRLFETWRADGVVELQQYLSEDPKRIAACSEAIRVVAVNRKTLLLFEAESADQLMQHLGSVFRDDMLATHAGELIQLWAGQTEFSSHSVNYTLSGKRLDIQLSGRILPGHEHDWDRVLVAVENVSEREAARSKLAFSEAYARGLFEHSPVSLWVEDFSGVKLLIEEARRMGISDFQVFTDVHPEFVDRCMREIRVIDVNKHTLELFGAPDKATLLSRTGDVFRGQMHQHFKEQLIDLWKNVLFHQREVVNYKLDGTELHLHMQFSVLPGHESHWTLVQIALTDITARKKAEAYLEFLGKRDALTGLYNRSFYTEELNSLERKEVLPVTIIVADLNGLKSINDDVGHAAGDGLLRRFGEVLTEAVHAPWCAARIGGDEFAIILSRADADAGKTLMDDIQRLVEVNNQFYPGSHISVSLGAATTKNKERLEAVFGRADGRMYDAKRALYTRSEHDRRRQRSSAAQRRRAG